MTSLNQADEHVKLAVDLILLLEQNQIPPQLALKALAIVQSDCLGKLQQLAATDESCIKG